MRFSIICVAIMFVIISVIGLSIIMHRSRTTEDDDKRCRDVTGYGEYVFGAAPSDFDFTGWENAEATVEVGFHPETVTTLMVNDEYNFSISAGRTEATIAVGFKDNKLLQVGIYITAIGDLDDINEYGEALRAAIANKYEGSMIVPDGINEEVSLFIVDSEGDCIGLGWDSDGVRLGYARADYWNTVHTDGEEKL